MRALAALALVAAVLAGCAPPPPPPPSDPRVFLTPDTGVFADPPIVIAGPPIRVSVRLVNPSAADHPVLQTTDWVNASGMPVKSMMSVPQRLTVPRFGDAVITAIAPNPAAVQFRIRVEPDYSAP